tara:strand:+ start:245 stop:370 length:126 start_codon:yes stop_codon:yes gene_type:complete
MNHTVAIVSISGECAGEKVVILKDTGFMAAYLPLDMGLIEV